MHKITQNSLLKKHGIFCLTFSVAQAIIGQFPDTDLDTLEAVTARHRQIGVWNTPLTMEQASLERLETVMTQAGELTKAQWVDFNELVDNHWAEAAR